MSDDVEAPVDNEALRADRLKKAPGAYRTISEVAEELHVPQHVLRFWETRFPEVRPLKRGGGRRYYRPEDIAVLRRISDLLYVHGYTIKGVQRVLREGEADETPDDATVEDGVGEVAAAGGSESLQAEADVSISEIVSLDTGADEEGADTGDASLSAALFESVRAERDLLREELSAILVELDDLRRLLPQ